MKALKDGKEIARLLARLRAVGRRFAAQAQRARHLGRDVRSLPEPGAVDAARDPDALRRRRRPRPRRGARARRSSRTTSAWAARAIPQLVEAAARVTAREVAGTGIDWNFAPVHRRRARRALGAHVRELRRIARAGREPGRRRHPRLRAAPTDGTRDPGHAPSTSSPTAAPRAARTRATRASPEEDLRRIHLPGYAAAIKAGVGSVMVSYSSWNGQPMHGNKHLITDVLKGELGFAGLRRHRLGRRSI